MARGREREGVGTYREEPIAEAVADLVDAGDDGLLEALLVGELVLQLVRARDECRARCRATRGQLVGGRSRARRVEVESRT